MPCLSPVAASAKPYTQTRTGAEAQSNRQAATRALAWLKGQQRPDGSYGDVLGSQSGNPGAVGAAFAESTVYALLAILSAEDDPTPYSKNGNTPVTYLEGHVPDILAISERPSSPGFALVAASMLKQQKQPSFAPEGTLVNEINTLYDSQSGFYGPEHLIYGRNLDLHISALLGLASANNPLPQEAIAALESRQAPDGGWSSSSGSASDTRVTALALQALVAVGSSRASPLALGKAKGFLLSQQNQDGGFPLIKGSECCAESDAVSTAFAVQALIPLETGPVDLDSMSKALAFLRSLQRESGAFADKLSQPAESLGATYHVVPALLGVSFASPLSTSGGNPAQAIPDMPSAGASGENSHLFAWFFSVAVCLLISGLVVRGAGWRPRQVRSTRYTSSTRIRH
jgi:hypothetical protein